MHGNFDGAGTPGSGHTNITVSGRVCWAGSLESRYVQGHRRGQAEVGSQAARTPRAQARSSASRPPQPKHTVFHRPRALRRAELIRR